MKQKYPMHPRVGANVRLLQFTEEDLKDRPPQHFPGLVVLSHGYVGGIGGDSGLAVSATLQRELLVFVRNRTGLVYEYDHWPHFRLTL